MSWESKDRWLLAGILIVMVAITVVGVYKVWKDQERTRLPVLPHTHPAPAEGDQPQTPATTNGDQPPRRVTTDVETDAARPVTLTFEEHAAAWISHDNAFVHGKGEYRKHRGGVVFQLGSYRDYRTNRIEVQFTNVEIEGTATTQKFERGNFDWINLVSADPNKTDSPIGPRDIGYLYLDAETRAECSMVEACKGKRCLGPGELQPLPEQCLRLRQVDARWKPDAIMTYWQGARGYDVQSRHDGEHSDFTFKLRDPVTATVYRGGRRLPLEVGRIISIRINISGHVDHGEVHDPGLGGGKTKGP